MKNKLLVIQPINNNVRDHEFFSICEKVGVSTQEALAWDLFNDDHKSIWEENKLSVGGIIIGGAPYSVTDLQIEHQMNTMRDVVLEAMDLGIPILGICFGHQALAYILGGKVNHDVTRKQKGFARIYNTEAAQSDPLLCHLSESFISRVNHEDHVDEWPENIVHLCYNSVSEMQAFRHADKPVWGVQFHPEISKEDVEYRYTHFGDTYFATKEEQVDACAHLIPSDHDVHDILKNFWIFAQEKA